jgi:hypothetical protein
MASTAGLMGVFMALLTELLQAGAPIGYPHPDNPYMPSH